MPQDVTPIAVEQRPVIVLPAHLPAKCFADAARDYAVPDLLLVAIVRRESSGRVGLATENRNGSRDLGVAGHNTGSWVKYFRERYAIPAEELQFNPCQSIRAAAYALRWEQNRPACRGRDIWCGVGRYHAPNSPDLAARYVRDVQRDLQAVVSRGRF